VTKNLKTKIIAEIGINHGGSVSKALKHVVAAKNSGADVVKFQFFKTTSLVSKNAKKARYQLHSTKDKQKQFNLLKPLELSIKDFLKIKKFCANKKIEFMISIFDESGIEAIKKLKVSSVKIPSGEINNYPLLEKISKLNKKIILSTGMSNFKEINNAMKIFTHNGIKKKEITILQCNSSYPTPLDDVNLNILKEYKKRFKVKIGYSDHTEGLDSSLAAVSLGASVIEKHFTLNKKLKGPDHSSSLNPSEFKKLTYHIRNIERCLGSKIKKITKSEKENYQAVRKSIVACSFIKKGEKFNLKNITTKRPAGGLSPEKWNKVIGKTAKKNFKEDEFIKI
jgi:N,N'-diacetyllegionaminate synthase